LRIGIFEDKKVTDSYPLTYSRPFYDLRLGILTLNERFEKIFRGDEVCYYCRDFLQDLWQERYPEAAVNEFPQEDTLFINGRLILNLWFDLPKLSDESIAFKKDDEIVAAYITADTMEQVQKAQHYGELQFDQLSFQKVEKVDWPILRYPWDFLQANSKQITEDLTLISDYRKVNPKEYPGAHFVNPEQIFVAENVIIKAGAVIDADEGPVYLADEAKVFHNAVIVGPCSIGWKSKISHGAKLTGNCSFGPVSNVGGEVGDTIIQGYSNKKHDGFLGGAFLGEWVNLGADTNNSDLKNNYSTVSVPLHGEPIDTGLQFAGCYIGDHTKTAIGTTINTGSVFGVGCNIFGSGFSPKFVPSFSWGGGENIVEHKFEKMINTAQIVESRRDKNLTPAQITVLKHVYEITSPFRDYP
jgi:UDP-N-acetylglucosamine diphosphorylase/glucosamine-1-phosphate N-acetyltransferase